MKGIFIATDTPLIGGVLTYLRDIALRLSASGISVAVGLRNLPHLIPIIDELRQHSIHVTHPFDVTFFQHGYLPLITGYGPFSYRRFFSTFGKKNLVLLVHDQVDIYYPQPFQFLYRLGYRYLQVPNLQNARAIITVSHWAKSFLQDFYGLAQVYAVPNAVDVHRFRPELSKENRGERKESLGLRPEKDLILIPGRLSPEKNPFLPLRVAQLLPEIDFAYVGTGELEGPVRLAQKALRLGNVFFLGKRYDMPNVYAAADAVLQPTLGENQSISTLEAMACGLPVITSDIPAQREIINHRQTGVLSPPEPKHMAKWILYALENREELGNNARAYVVLHHNLDFYLPRLLSTLNEIAALI